MVYRRRFAKRLIKLADGAHGPVLQLFKKQNRELPYASVRPGKPCKGQRYFNPDRRNRAITLQVLSLLREGLFAVSM